MTDPPVRVGHKGLSRTRKVTRSVTGPGRPSESGSSGRTYERGPCIGKRPDASP